MDASSFFDYPDEAELSDHKALVFLPKLGEDSWAVLLSFTQRRLFRAGEDVVRAGDTEGQALYIVGRGALQVVLPLPHGKRLRLANLAAGTVFGEQAFLDGQPHSATVRGVADGEVHVLSPESFEILAAGHPELARLMLMDMGRIISMRLRQTMNMAVNGI